ncbi:PAS domain-containing sensor histidine kinase [Sulfurospirillum barnesii]|uniref:histidine kinase n=1 Tax=Sulfurospirillum barnesii (strain ATCC 700032 / DSM 10660 / SES-3) TaxID=760154 RepID=I3XZE0_SULBS|nr:PAS domain-containing sensor histidine kinase [Sulfurospirillum barnesii]AFL69314.1 PAS domain S-box [Sulfurospirillum barnesii SES-3]
MKLEQYQEAIESSNIISKTDINGIITFVNDEFCKISGYSKEELIGQNHNIVRHPDVDASIFKKLWQTILQKKAYKSTVKNKAKDGSTFYVNTTVFPILNEVGDIEEFIAIRYDVTESVRLSEALMTKDKELEELNATLEKRVEEQTKALVELNQTLEEKVKEEVEKNREKDRFLFQQSRLASMGEMIANIAHQWRQPLSELTITLYQMKKVYTKQHSDKDDAFEQSYAHAKKIISKMSETIEDFRNFFSPERQSDLFALSRVAKEAIDIMRGTLERNEVKIDLVVHSDVFIQGYFNEFSQVFINIINNSIDAFNMNNIKQRLIYIEIDTSMQGDAIMRLCDNAGGIEESLLDKVFEPYFTTKHASSGTGLGLYMSKMIVNNSMKGLIVVKNENDGACFTITIPKAKEGKGEK